MLDVDVGMRSEDRGASNYWKMDISAVLFSRIKSYLDRKSMHNASVATASGKMAIVLNTVVFCGYSAFINPYSPKTFFAY